MPKPIKKTPTFDAEEMTKLDMPVWRLDIHAIAILLLSVTFAWCTGWDMWTIRDWNEPTAYLEGRESDVLGMLASFKAAKDGHYVPLAPKVIPELGAPSGANWTAIPTVEEIPIWLTGILARWTGLFAALNIKLLIGHLLAALTFYLVARYSECLVPWAFLGGLAFGLAPFLFSESPHHSIVAYAWHVPLFLLIWNWTSTSPGIEPLSKRFWFAVGVAFITGLQNIYYTNIFCQLTLLGGILLFFRGRSRPALISTLAIIGASAIAFALMNLDTWIYQISHGGSSLAIARQFKWLEIYALKPSDLVLPLPTHHASVFRNFSLGHAQKTVLANEGSYLGLLGIAALLWVFFVSASGQLSRKQKSIPREAWQILWIFAVFVTGGLNSFLGICGITFFRAGYRMSIVILAIALLFCMQRASKLFETRKRLGVLLAAVLVLLVFYDEIPLTPSLQEKHQRGLQLEADKEFTRAMEDSMPPGAMIFQLPVMSFPEAPVPGITPYDHFRPYLYSNNLRYSFGLTKEDLETGWYSKLANLPLDQVVAILKKEGFGGIYINRKGFQDNGAAILKGLAEVGLTEKIESKAGDLVCVLIPM